jgi:dTDP-4-amino-4,6-dideoxygalactose transaminase
MDDVVPFFSLGTEHDKIKGELMNAIERVYDRGQFILGDELIEFEKRYAAFTGTEFCVGVGNGYDALVLSLRALGVGAGDEVLVPSNTYIATWLAVQAVGGTIVPVEPDPLTYNVNGNIAEKITTRTRAIIPVHLYGQSCRMDSITDLAAAGGLLIIEDNAQSQGARFKGRPTGSFGQSNATSFYPVNLGALGDAGAVTTSDKLFAVRFWP